VATTRKKAAVEFVRATVSFSADVRGVERFVSAGEVLRASDPVVAAHPDLFEPAEAPIETR
jgi:hypothetical protein